jgi:hypothetical protein
MTAIATVSCGSEAIGDAVEAQEGGSSGRVAERLGGGDVRCLEVTTDARLGGWWFSCAGVLGVWRRSGDLEALDVAPKVPFGLSE